MGLPHGRMKVSVLFVDYLRPASAVVIAAGDAPARTVGHERARDVGHGEVLAEKLFRRGDDEVDHAAAAAGHRVLRREFQRHEIAFGIGQARPVARERGFDLAVGLVVVRADGAGVVLQQQVSVGKCGVGGAVGRVVGRDQRVVGCRRYRISACRGYRAVDVERRVELVERTARRVAMAPVSTLSLPHMA